MEKIVIYGKGGIGKSFFATNLSMIYAKQGYRVLLIGCDPKHDSSISILNRNKITTVTNLLKIKDRDLIKPSDFIVKGLGGVDCIEAGGPEPGVGCAGYGISVMFEILKNLNILNENRYDIVIYDVLGDVVCGGFAAPLKFGFGRKVIVIVSEEHMSLYAANNICKAIKNYEHNGVFLSGLIINKKNNNESIRHINKFASIINADILGTIQRSKQVTIAETKRKPAIWLFPNSNLFASLNNISNKILKSKISRRKIVRPVNKLF